MLQTGFYPLPPMRSAGAGRRRERDSGWLHRGKQGDAKSSHPHNRGVKFHLSPVLVWPILLCATVACAAEAGADASSASGCERLLCVVRRSLEDEIGAACPAPATACAAQREPLRTIVDFIGKRHADDADACETLLEVNKRLRALPPKG